jgi:hypothetical protein
MSNEDEYLRKSTVHDEKRGAQTCFGFHEF